MGTGASWISVAGLTKTELLDRLGAVDTGEIVDWPDEEQLGLAELPSGRILVLSRLFTFAATRDREISLGADLVGGRVEDHVGYSASWQCKDGQLLWSMVRHDMEPDDLKIEGDLPAPYAARWQAAIDGGDEVTRSRVASALPLEAAAELGRFHYEDYLDKWDGRLSVLGEVYGFMGEAELAERQDHRAYLKVRDARKRAANPGFMGFLKRTLMID